MSIVYKKFLFLFIYLIVTCSIGLILSGLFINLLINLIDYILNSRFDYSINDAIKVMKGGIAGGVIIGIGAWIISILHELRKK
ncbi:hypothetical protein [Photorhabdus australis]|uniref:hypothetical protein n=1 Tax=Photorhabdus australis TaxID=286156 RepID=UPI0005648234|nr:hypothetical protein [Photorhabdus australis]